MFYIVETKEQLEELKEVIKKEDVFIKIITNNDNYHPKLATISLVYLKPLTSHKGYIIGINHSELIQSIEFKSLKDLISHHEANIYTLDAKQFTYFIPRTIVKVHDVNFMNLNNLILEEFNVCYNFYYKKQDITNINNLIPISQHYDICEQLASKAINYISRFKSNSIYICQKRMMEVFYSIESQGIKIDKSKFIEHFFDIINPGYNISKGKIYTNYNLYTTTGRPSNSFNGINFAALSKTNGERAAFIPDNNCFIEMDIKGYHPRLIAELINYNLPESDVYQHLNIDKKIMFQNLYGGIQKEYKEHDFFAKVDNYINHLWETYKTNGINASIRYYNNIENINPQKLFNYLLQSQETFRNILIIDDILRFLKTKNTKLVLYTYDAFLFDYCEKDGYIIPGLKEIIGYPVKVKQGINYDVLEEI